MTTPELTLDQAINAIYLRLSNEEVSETIELSRSTYLDVDRNGAPVGFEILSAAPFLVERLKTAQSGTSLADVIKLLAA